MPRTVYLLTSLLAVCLSAPAATITATLPEYGGPIPGGSFPQPEVTAGTFSFTPVSAASIVSATLQGFFGNSFVPTTAGVDVYFDSVKVAACQPYGDPCWTGPGPTAWSYTFSPAQYSLFSDGKGRFSFIQTNEYLVWFGVTTLTLQTQTLTQNPAQTAGDVPTGVPEPASLILSGAGMLALLSRRYCFGRAR